MIKRYLKTFTGKDSIGRKVGFIAFALTFAVLFYITFLETSLGGGKYRETFQFMNENFLSIFVPLSSGIVVTFIVDLITGIGRESPLFRNK